MDSKILEDVLVYLSPQFKLVSKMIAKRDFQGLEYFNSKIKDGRKRKIIKFGFKDNHLDINFKSLSKEKTKEWMSVFEKQLDLIEDMIKKVYQR